MKFTIDKAKLASMVQSTQRVVNAKSALPILQSILVEADNQGIKLTATDLNIGMRCCFATDVEEPGKVAIPAKNFSELVRKLPDGNVTLTTNEDNTRVIIQYGLFSEFTLGVLDASEYPLIPIPEDCRQVKLPQGILKEMIKQVIVAADINSDRPIFQGALLEINEGQIVIVSTDTHRLAYRHWPLPQEAASEQVSNVIIPARTLIELGRILDEDKEQPTLTVGFADNQIVFASETTTLISRLIEGKYPPFRNVVPKTFTSEITVKRAQLLNTLERAELLTRSTSEVTKFSLADGKLVVNVRSQAGSLHEEIIAMTHEGQPLVIGFNTEYLVDGLKTMDTEEVVIKFTGPVGAAVIQPVGNDTQFYLALPVRLAQAA